jgi:DNA-binding MarR family transcriptional regulator
MKNGYRKHELVKAYENLTKIKGECSYKLANEYGIGEMTVRQIGYLKIIAEHKGITFSRLADLTNNSKPTVTEMINKFVRCDCVYKEKCVNDGRVSYIRLTGKGENIAHAEKLIARNLVDRILRSLEEQEIDILIILLNKIK